MFRHKVVGFLISVALGTNFVAITEAQERRCADLGANCTCSEPLQATDYTKLNPSSGNFAWDPTDTTVKECVFEGVAHSPITTFNTAFASTNSTALSKLPAGNTVQRFLGMADGDTGIFFIGHTFPAPQTRMAVRWYRYYSPNFQFANEGGCTNGKISEHGHGSPTNVVFTHEGPAAAYGFGNNWNPSPLDCCFSGYPGGDPTNLSMSNNSWRGKWWRFEAVFVNPSGGSAPNGMQFYLYVKNVTDGTPEFVALNSTIPCASCGFNPWNTTAATALTPPATLLNLNTSMYRAGSCTGWAGHAYFMGASWSTNAGQRIGAAVEVEGGGQTPFPSAPQLPIVR